MSAERLHERLRQLRATSSPRRGESAAADYHSQVTAPGPVPNQVLLGSFATVTNSPSVRDLFNQKREGIRKREASLG